MLTRSYNPRRTGFTLVELLVAAALTVLVMAILATAFQKGMSTFSHLKSTVTLSEHLRSTEAVIRRDLEAVHLETETGEPVRVSNPGFASAAWVAPNRGFFEIIKHVDTSAGSQYVYVDEGSEEGVASHLVTGDSIAFTSKLSAASKDDVFVGEVTRTSGTNAGQILANWSTLQDLSPSAAQTVGPWAELYYFLVPNGLDTTTDDPAVGGSPQKLYTLCRRQGLLAPQRSTAFAPTDVNQRLVDYTSPTNPVSLYPELSVSTYPFYAPNMTSFWPPPVGQQFVNDASTLTDWRNRMRFKWSHTPSGVMPNASFASPRGVSDAQRLTITPTATSNPPISYWLPSTINNPPQKVGTEFLLSNVISFQVRPMFGTSYVDELPKSTSSNPAAPDPGVYPRLWDTGVLSNRNVGPNPPSVLKGVQLKLRIWDTKNRLTRQMTISVDL